MKRIFFTLFSILLSATAAFAQDIHSPTEIFKIMESSPVTYEIGMLNDEIPVPDRSENLNFNHYYRVIDDGQILTYNYEIGPESEEHLQEAEKHFEDKDFTAARESYMKALETDSTLYYVMAYIAQTYGIEGDYEKAREWYVKTIELNYIDYLAHWLLADIYKLTGEKKKALEEVTIARILNPNNPRLKKLFEEIYELNKIKTPQWVFNPQVKVDSTGPNKVSINYAGKWLGYALVKALWLYEPGYSESMGAGPGTFSSLEEKEALAALYLTLDKKDIKKNPEFKALDRSIEAKMLDEYILYEIMLPRFPALAYQLTEDDIQDIKEYVLQIRSKK